MSSFWIKIQILGQGRIFVTGIVDVGMVSYIDRTRPRSRPIRTCKCRAVYYVHGRVRNQSGECEYSVDAVHLVISSGKFPAVKVLEIT